MGTEKVYTFKNTVTVELYAGARRWFGLQSDNSDLISVIVTRICAVQSCMLTS